MYSGSQYKQLARFLCQGTASAPLPRNPFPHVIVHTLSSKERKQYEFDAYEEISAFLTCPAPSSGTSQIVFVRGISSHDWLNAIGSKYRVDPEFLRRHLEFIQTTNFYDLPPLPSSTRNFIQLKIINICVQSAPLSLRQLQEARETEGKSVKELQNNLMLRDSCGDSILRRISIHSRTLYTIEQQVSCCVKKQNGSWVGAASNFLRHSPEMANIATVVVWLDTGKTQYRNSSDLFVRRNTDLNPFKEAASSPDVCYPVIRHQSKVTFEDKEMQEHHMPSMTETKKSLSRNFEPSANLLPSQYGGSLDPAIMAQDPFYALAELFEFSASSHNQFLNMMETLIAEDIHSFAKHPDVSFANLSHHKVLLDEHLKYLPTAISSLRHRGGSWWPRATDSAADEVVNETIQNLLPDFEHLLELTQRLSARCVEGTTLIINTAMLEESKKAISLSENMSGLTKLASFFVPISLVCSFFGMDVIEFGQGTLRLGIIIAVLVPVVLASVVLCYTSSILALIHICIRWFGNGSLE